MSLSNDLNVKKLLMRCVWLKRQKDKNFEKEILSSHLFHKKACEQEAMFIIRIRVHLLSFPTYVTSHLCLLNPFGDESP